MAAVAARVDLRALLAECVAACGLGCGEVRAWQAARTAETGAELKDPNDLRRGVHAGRCGPGPSSGADAPGGTDRPGCGVAAT